MNVISNTFYCIAFYFPLSAMAEVIVGPDETRTTPIVQSSGDITRILDNVTVDTSGTNSHAILATNGSISLEGTNINVITSNTTNNWAYGIYALASSGASVSITSSGVSPTITTYGNTSYAVIASGRNANGLESFNFDGINLYTHGLSSAAIMLNNAVGVIKDAFIQTTASRITGTIIGAYGMNPQENSVLYASNVRIDNTGDYGTGIFTTGTLIADHLNIKTGGYSAFGSNTQTTGNTTINNSAIQTYGEVGHAIRLSGTSSEIPLFSGEDLILETHGYSASGVVTFNNSQADINNAAIKTFNNASSGLYAYQSNSIINASQVTIETQGTGSYGVIANSGGTINITDSNILTNGTNSAGLYVAGLNLDPILTTATAVNTVIETLGSESAALTIFKGGTLNIHNVRAMASGSLSPGLAIGSDSDFANIVFATNSSIISKHDAGVRITGGISQINLDSTFVQGASYWLNVGITAVPSSLILEQPGDDEGVGASLFLATETPQKEDNNPLVAPTPITTNIFASNTTLIGGAFTSEGALSNVELSNGSTWSMTASSNLTRLVNTASSIIFSAPLNNLYKTLTVNNYAGGNSFIQLNTFLQADDSPTDKLVIDGGSATGSTGLAINNHGGLGALTQGKGILLVDAINNGTTANDAFFLSHEVIAGPYEYTLHRGDTDENWYLVSMQEPEPPTPTPTPPPNPKPDYRREVSLNSAIHSMALSYSRAILGTFHQRVGAEELDRKVNNVARIVDGSWLRIVNHHNTIKNNGIFDEGPNFKNHLTALQLGVDLLQRENGAGHRDFAGLSGTAGKNKGDVEHYTGLYAGQVTFDAYGIGAYWTHLGPNDWYIDAVFQSNHYKPKSNSGRALLNSSSIKNYGGSLEGGYPFKINPRLNIEPQAQIIYQQLSGTKANDIAANIHLDRTNSLVGRLGTRFAWDWLFNNSENMQSPKLRTWLTTSVWHEGKGKSTTTFSSADGLVPFTSTLAGTWFEADLGITAQVNDRVALYGTLAHETYLNGRGKAYDAIVGVRVSL
ncbi:autotransporter outer membrane beta-barrel domain-containing protein [uncultured Legionella sp.]|uniref:autotransporter family protein n=1 Tax=uncultured Legionella sp. TaxID=210934 RepID=UPI0026117EFF|nr:autotransporter outer membrane beta-barrel domain-containing protein [uncultured Legionella sp.]